VDFRRICRGPLISYVLTGLGTLATISGEIAAGEDVTISLLLFSFLAVSLLLKPSVKLRGFESIFISGIFFLFVIEGVIRSDIKILSLVHFLIFVQIFLLLFHAEDLRPRKYIVAISLMQLLVASTLNDDVDFFLLLLLYIPISIVALFSLYIDSSAHIPRASPQISYAQIAIVLLMMTATALTMSLVVFIVFPRVTTPDLLAGMGIMMYQRPEVTESVKLGDMVRMLDDETIVLTVTGDLQAPLRIAAMDHYEYGEWSNTITRFRNLRPVGDGWRIISDTPDVAFQQLPVIEILIKTYNRREVPSLLDTVAIKLPFFLIVRDANDIFQAHRELKEGVRYQLVASPTLPGTQQSRHHSSDTVNQPVHHQYLQLPSSLSPRVFELAESITAGANSPSEKATKIRDYLLRNYQYSLRHNRTQDIDPVEDFLFNERRGHCEYFASAMTVLLRAQDIPARLAAGYSPGSPDDGVNTYMIRRSAAHSWSEAWIPTEGWIPFDATPPRNDDQGRLGRRWNQFVRKLDFIWRKQIVDFSQERQKAMMEHLRKMTSAALIKLRSFKDSIFSRWSVHFPVTRFLGIIMASVATLLLVSYSAHLLSMSKRRRRHRREFRREELVIFNLYRRMSKALKRAGYIREPHKTPSEFSSDIERVDPELGCLVRVVTEEYYRVRYGRESLTGERVNVIKQIIKKISKGGSHANAINNAR